MPLRPEVLTRIELALPLDGLAWSTPLGESDRPEAAVLVDAVVTRAATGEPENPLVPEPSRSR